MTTDEPVAPKFKPKRVTRQKQDPNAELQKKERQTRVPRKSTSGPLRKREDQQAFSEGIFSQGVNVTRKASSSSKVYSAAVPASLPGKNHSNNALGIPVAEESQDDDCFANITVDQPPNEIEQLIQEQMHLEESLFYSEIRKILSASVKEASFVQHEQLKEETRVEQLTLLQLPPQLYAAQQGQVGEMLIMASGELIFESNDGVRYQIKEGTLGPFYHEMIVYDGKDVVVCGSVPRKMIFVPQQ